MEIHLDSKLKGMVWGSFCGDALALGVHWIYDPALIKNEYGRVTGYIKPGRNSFHPTKEQGEFTHYGDQMLVLLETVATDEIFDINGFARRWRALFDSYNGYIDKATRNTLENFKKNQDALHAGSVSEDLAGAVRIAPLVCRLHAHPDRLKGAVEEQTRMTHNHPHTVTTANFFAEAALGVLNGGSPAEVIASLAGESYGQLNPLIQKGLDSIAAESVEAIGGFGRDCSLGSALPGVVHLVVKYEDNLKEALITSVMAGGDSAARSMAVGMILGAHLGEKSVPPEWMAGLKRKNDIQRLVELAAGRGH